MKPFLGGSVGYKKGGCSLKKESGMCYDLAQPSSSMWRMFGHKITKKLHCSMKAGMPQPASLKLPAHLSRWKRGRKFGIQTIKQKCSLTVGSLVLYNPCKSKTIEKNNSLLKSAVVSKTMGSLTSTGYSKEIHCSKFGPSSTLSRFPEAGPRRPP